MNGQRFNPPPNWPRPPDGWLPPPGWQPPPHWPPAPRDWQFVVADPATVPASPAAVASPQWARALSFTAAAMLPATVLLIGATVCYLPPFIAEVESGLMTLAGLAIGTWLAVRVLLTSRLNFFIDPIRLVAGAVRGKIPHLVASFVLAQGALFGLATLLVINTDPGRCGL